MRIFSFAMLFQATLLTSAYADPAVTTTNVNLRSGPGAGFSSLAKVPASTQVELGQCDAEGAWCNVTVDGKAGFMSGQYLNQAEPDRPSWPRSFTTDNGAEVILYQPQVTSWKNFTDLTALVATEYRANKDAQPAYGVIDLEAHTQADQDSGEVVLTDIRTSRLDFSALDRPHLDDLSLAVGKILPTGPVTFPEERLTASLADFERLDDVAYLKSDPPPIFITKTPAILVQTDGKEVAAPVKGVSGLSFVVNSNWDIFKTDADGSYFLRDEKSWLTAKSLDGNWQAATSLPDLLAKIPDEDNWKDAKAAQPPSPFANGVVPKVVYSATPAELIQFDGEPKLEAIRDGGLEWVSNSDGAVFFRKASQEWYVLLSGRWFSAKSLDGPWTFATPKLPADFRDIPDGEDYSWVRASIPGTSENAEARLKASIPEMARVATDGTVTADVAYSGDPKFEPIEGTSLSYAVNTDATVIKVANQYFLLKDGVWFVGDRPTGPFKVAAEVPAAIYKIPPSSPVYNATYVRVYSTEPGAVWFGYTLGYLGAYLAWDSLVYGTGWDYPAYWDTGWTNGYWPYYPRPVSYGVGAFYNPARGTFGRYGYAYGPYRGIAGGVAYNPRTGTYFRGGAVAGPAGERGFVAAYNPRTNTGALARGGSNVYGSWGTAGVRRGSDWARASGGSLAGGGEAARWRTSAGNQGFVAEGKGGDIYAGRDGNVYRRDDGQWQKHTNDGWQPVQKPSTENAKKAGQHFASNHPATANAIKNNPRISHPVVQRPQRIARAVTPQHLGIDRAGRLAGNQRALAHRMEFHPGGGGGFRGGAHGGGRLLRR